MTTELYVGGFIDNSGVNGIGLRSVIFLSGCRHRCKGCQNEFLQDRASGQLMQVEDLVKRVQNNMPYIKGVTLSGGEPFDQDCSLLLEKVKALDLDVWAYTGYTIDSLLRDRRPYIQQMLENIDVVVDGKFIQELTKHAPKYVGSTNQRFILLNQGKVIDICKEFEERKISYKGNTI